MLLDEYIQEQITTLKELYLWQYLSNEEKEELRQSKSEEKISRLMRKFRDKYYDQMINDYEYSPEEEYLDVPLEELELKTKTFHSLKRAHINTSGEFIDFVKENGWAKIDRFGATAAKDIYMQIYDVMNEEEIEKLVKKTKNKGEN